MFTTILRQEARLTLRPMLIGLGLLALVYLLSLGLVALNWPVVASVALVAAVLCAVGLPAGMAVYLLVHYARSMYGRAGYFTMTVPVRGRVLYSAKAVYAFVAILIALVIGLPAMFVALGVQSRANGAGFWSLLRPYADGLAAHPVLAWVAVISALFLVALTVAQYSFYVTVGCEARFASLGLGGPVVVYVIAYVVMQLVTVLGMLAIPVGLHLGDTNELVRVHMADFLQGAQANNNSNEVVPLGFVPVMVLALVVYVIWTIRSIERRTSLR